MTREFNSSRGGSGHYSARHKRQRLEAEVRVLEALPRNEGAAIDPVGFTRAQCAAAVGVSEETARAHLKRLVARGRIVEFKAKNEKHWEYRYFTTLYHVSRHQAELASMGPPLTRDDVVKLPQAIPLSCWKAKGGE